MSPSLEMCGQIAYGDYDGYSWVIEGKLRGRAMGMIIPGRIN